MFLCGPSMNIEHLNNRENQKSFAVCRHFAYSVLTGYLYENEEWMLDPALSPLCDDPVSEPW